MLLHHDDNEKDPFSPCLCPPSFLHCHPYLFDERRSLIDARVVDSAARHNVDDVMRAALE